MVHATLHRMLLIQFHFFVGAIIRFIRKFKYIELLILLSFIDDAISPVFCGNVNSITPLIFCQLLIN